MNCDSAFELLSQQCPAKTFFLQLYSWTAIHKRFVLLTFVHFLIAYYIPFRQCTLVPFWCTLSRLLSTLCTRRRLGLYKKCSRNRHLSLWYYFFLFSRACTASNSTLFTCCWLRRRRKPAMILEALKRERVHESALCARERTKENGKVKINKKKGKMNESSKWINEWMNERIDEWMNRTQQRTLDSNCLIECQCVFVFLCVEGQRNWNQSTDQCLLLSPFLFSYIDHTKLTFILSTLYWIEFIICALSC